VSTVTIANFRPMHVLCPIEKGR